MEAIVTAIQLLSETTIDRRHRNSDDRNYWFGRSQFSLDDG